MVKKGIFGIDLFLVIPVLILVGISLVTLFSLSFDLFKSQFIFLIISIFFFLFFSQINFKVLRVYSLPIYIVSIILLTLVLFLGIESRGSIRWIDVFGFRIQFSEILKPFLAVSFATYLIDNRKYDFKSLISIFFLV